MFDTVLVANRGEIARRVIRTLRRLGIRSVAVYSDADADAPHVHEADAAVRIGPAAASLSYLDVEAVIGAALQTGAQAIHPGYGFLSENAGFAQACAAAGIVFIGPDERALEVMADKIRAKAHVARHGVPVVPGFSARGMDDDDILAEAQRIGLPLLIKPSAGGGGKGMQVVREASELRDALAAARRVSAAAFGDDTLLLERLIDGPRHIEVQVLADAHGAVIHLGERECTLQRRHQKVIEEAPSPVVDERTRARLGAAARAAAESVDYRGAGTVEFLVAADRPDEFFFIEMNTRLQVEHPVTELVTGLDLVELQLRVAAGEHLPIAQDDVRLHGHAIEARVYAEAPARGFLPATGEVLMWREPAGVRTDAAVETGSIVSADYDPMIAKVIAWGEDRASALERLDDALARTVLLGVDANIGFLRTLLGAPAVRAGDLDTGLIDRMPPHTDPEPTMAALTAVATQLAVAHPSLEPRRAVSALWASGGGWRAGAAPSVVAQRFETASGQIVTATTGDPGDAVVAGPDGDGRVWVHDAGTAYVLRPLSRREAADLRRARRERTAHATDPELRAPMPGAVVAVHVADGASVAAGERILTIEAMKMEHPLIAAHDGVVRLDAAVGDQVRRDQVLAHVSANGE
ncbi:acetyl/propionyl/methylcrotonyl-CoA carboxylase subunit alpha [Microbacterium rhizomatis]|uniref:biotin carboxylase n=1 Tax=Microbacterium rhizomatis TaxID=1631477 RepID=A0A5J5J7Q1_9MICO|nr:biotin carboxylase N-terminal domain-containing protein [Microbacterium rhizomatis]KAA9110813.1 ATP-grasp domain-containing protein [Microbacterium rhizomatis]